MKTLFVASGPIEWASARLRCFWPAQYMEGAKVVTASDVDALVTETVAADALIYQKVFDPTIAKSARMLSKRVYWDLCDPLWWFSPDGCRSNLEHCDGVVLSSEALKTDFDEWSDGRVRSWCIPDRIKLYHYPLKRVHAEVSPVRLIWFGLAVNRWALLSALANLERLAANGHKIELTIMDNQPGEWRVTDAFPIYTVPWSLEQENEIIAAHDLAVLPPYPGPWGVVKSNNRTLTALACGVPWCSGLNYHDLENLVSNLKWRTDCGKQDLNAHWFKPEISASEWEAILCKS